MEIDVLHFWNTVYRY